LKKLVPPQALFPLTIENVDHDGFRLRVGRIALVLPVVGGPCLLNQEVGHGGLSLLGDDVNAAPLGIIADDLHRGGREVGEDVSLFIFEFVTRQVKKKLWPYEEDISEIYRLKVRLQLWTKPYFVIPLCSLNEYQSIFLGIFSSTK
jgi:hypothetical protein